MSFINKLKFLKEGLNQNMEADEIKENTSLRSELSWWWVVAGLATCAAALGAAHRLDTWLPPPRPLTDPQLFSGLLAHRFLENLTALGPRVAGTYENEVAAVRVLTEALRRAADTASPHNRVELDVHTASGAFSLSFMDGMNNVYRDVQSVVVRVRAAGGAPTDARDALLLNCHYDTVPDSPGASDDGAGCAVLVETVRALAAGPPLRRPAVFLFNGAEENIMQASHAFVSSHRWARSLRAFVNVEACGAGGREVLFQAGPRDPWILHVYAAVVPYPFASSLAQELFESGVVPADTDFRIFRDFGNLSGVDLAWSSNGYVYHTRLDTAERVPPAVLQRTGDNVLALTRGLLAAKGREAGELPVYFDVGGWRVVAVSPPAALLGAVLTIALVLLKIHLNAEYARKHLYVRRREWWALVARLAGAGAGAALGGALAAGGVALALGAGGARLATYSRAWLVAPLYGAPALGAAGALAARLGGGRAARGAGGARAWHDAGAAAWAALLALCAARGLRSGFVPLLWAASGATDAAAALLGAGPRRRALLWAGAALGPALLTAALALGVLQLLVPLTGRAGAGPPPPDVTLALVSAAAAMLLCHWLLPLLPLTDRRLPARLAKLSGTVTGLTMLAVACTPLGEPYSAERPQRLMVFHTRRTEHPPAGAPLVEHFYWVPQLDVNTPRTLRHIPQLAGAREWPREECERHAYCGAPYYLPVLGLISSSLAAPAPAALPAAAALRLNVSLAVQRAGAAELRLEAEGGAHLALVLAPARGVRLALADVLPRGLRRAAPWRGGPTYFVALHAARRPRAWRLRVRLERDEPAPPGPAGWVHVSAASHALGERGAALDALLAAAPPHVAATGWPADLHLYHL